MKKIFLAFCIAFSFTAFAEEIPVPAKVVMFNYPTLNGIPFAAVFAHDYKTNDEVGGVNISGMTANSARFICLFLGYDRVYSYGLTRVTQEKSTVLFIDQYLVANPVETTWIDGNKKGEFATTVFSKLGCFRNSTRPY